MTTADPVVQPPSAGRWVQRCSGVALAAAVLALSVSCAPRPPNPPGAEPNSGEPAEPIDSDRMRGIALGLHAQDPTHDYGPRLAEIADLGADWVLLCFNFYQEFVDSIEVGIPDERTQSWDRIRTAIRQAHGFGLRVGLLPIILIREPGESDWRGTIRPSDRDAWYRSYGEWFATVTELAESERVELLSVGSELNSMQTDTERWRTIIHSTRERFSGKLTYSVNWDSITAPEFYGDLDYVGMTTYFSLTDEDDPSVEELTSRWREIREDLTAWNAHVGKPMIFTEVGFPSQDGANRDPWNYYISEVVDLAEQRDCFEAFTRVWLHEPALRGVFFYNWYEEGGESDRGYSPRGKPALDVIRRWFQSRRDPDANDPLARTP